MFLNVNKYTLKHKYENVPYTNIINYIYYNISLYLQVIQNIIFKNIMCKKKSSIENILFKSNAYIIY